ncbi:MAG: exodeoxyribonuclease III [Caenispirillum sp.]|nr:exodeoxyribonuclease III [Caenispirillum sp.]
MLKIAAWNVNSIKARLPNLTAWLTEAQPDVALLQEIKTVDDGFPLMEIRAAGYEHCAICGQKSYNGVAILSRHPLTEVRRGLPGEPEDQQARYVEAVVDGRIRVASVYVPNGNPVDTEKFPYKLRWMENLRLHLRRLLTESDLPLLVGGDYNVCPTDDDVYDPDGWSNDALCRPESRAAFRALLWLGLTDTYRTLHPEPHRYTFWDYQQGAWQRDLGLRIDHLLLDGRALDRVRACDIDKGPRGREKASDHTPIWAEIEV